jgi:hypothetical protein
VTPAKQVKQRLKTTSRRANRFINYVSPNTASYFSLFYLNQGSGMGCVLEGNRGERGKVKG